MTRTPYALSLFDKTPVPDGTTGAEAIAFSVAFAREAEALGYHSIWYAEHHGAPPLAGSAPEILAAYVLASTRTIRIGSGGVLLQHYSPYKVAEQFRVLAALAPGRVDLGVGKAPGGLPFSTHALQVGQTPASAQSFDQKLGDLTAFLGDGLAEGHALHGVKAYPDIAERPELFLLGASLESAEIAARYGWNLTFAGHFDGGDDAIRATFGAYEGRTGRKPSLSLSVIVSDDQAQAERLAAQQTIYRVHLPDGRNVNLPNEDAAREYARQAGSPEYRLEPRNPRILAGTPALVRAELDRLSTTFGITHFFIDLPVADPAQRLAAIRHLAPQAQALAAAE